MAFTRFHDDEARVEKQLQESTGPGRYMLNVPGNGTHPCFMEDPFVRLDKWGANLRTNTVNLDSSLKGLGRPLDRDCLVNRNVNFIPENEAIQYPTCQPFTDQSRVTNPAWTTRDLEQVNWYILPMDPQANVCIPFHNNVSTRIVEKDKYTPKMPCINNNN